MIKVKVNGSEVEFEEGTRLEALLAQLDLPDARIAVELNKSVVRKGEWADTVVADSDVLEIVQFVGGG